MLPPIGYMDPIALPAVGSQAVGPVEPPDKPDLNPDGCETCASRRYVDQSSDSSVSFQTPTKLSPSEAALAVAAHEYEHVINNREKADREGMVAHSTVTINYGVCPDCGQMYVAGGKTKNALRPQKT